MWTASWNPAEPCGTTLRMRIWTPMPAGASQARRISRSANAVRRPRASGTVARATRKRTPRSISRPASARTPYDLAPTNVQLLSFGLAEADEGRVSAFGWTGSHDKEVIRQMKARLYRTALAVSMIAVLLEGLGAYWKW